MGGYEYWGIDVYEPKNDIIRKVRVRENKRGREREKETERI